MLALKFSVPHPPPVFTSLLPQSRFYDPSAAASLEHVLVFTQHTIKALTLGRPVLHSAPFSTKSAWLEENHNFMDWSSSKSKLTQL